MLNEVSLFQQGNTGDLGMSDLSSELQGHAQENGREEKRREEKRREEKRREEKRREEE